MKTDLEVKIIDIMKKPIVQNILEPAAYGVAYLNGVLAQNDAYISGQNLDFGNGTLIAQTLCLYLTEIVGDIGRKVSSEKGEKLAKIIQKTADIVEYTAGGINAAIALWYFPLTGVLLRPAVDGIFGHGTSFKIDNALAPVYSSNFTVPALLSFANFYAARKENAVKKEIVA